MFAWTVVLLSFFILAIQLFVTLIEFKLTTLAGFILIPFGLFGKTAFLAERVLGNVVSSGVKVLVLAVIVGVGSTLFAQFTQSAPGAQPTVDDAMALVLAALSLLGLGIFGPGVANGIVSGGPQLGAGAVVGTGLTVGGAVLAGAGAARMAGGALMGLGRKERDAGRRRCCRRHAVPTRPAAVLRAERRRAQVERREEEQRPLSNPPLRNFLARRRSAASATPSFRRFSCRRTRLGQTHQTQPVRRSRRLARRPFHSRRRRPWRRNIHQSF